MHGHIGENGCDMWQGTEKGTAVKQTEINAIIARYLSVVSTLGLVITKNEAQDWHQLLERFKQKTHSNIHLPSHIICIK